MGMKGISLSILALFYIISGIICDDQNGTSLPAGQELQKPTEQTRTVSFRMAARSLPIEGVDPAGGPPDPYVRVYRSNGSVWEFFLRTEWSLNNRNPNWLEIVRDRVSLNVGQKWKFEIMDYDPIGEDDYLGEVVIPVEEYLNITADFLAKPIRPPGSGTFIIYKYT